MFSAIADFLQGQRVEATSRSARELWRDRPLISRAETDMLMALVERPLSVHALAGILGREDCGLQELLDAMVAIGVLESSGEEYCASQATVAYCRAIAQDALPLSPDEGL
jgi:hypothetical protein